MKASKKSILYTIFFITAILMFMSAWLSSISVKTAVYADGALRDFYTEGASVRDADPTGIRFETKIKTTLYEELKGKSDITFGTLIVPKAVLGENELTVENLQTANAVTERWAADEGDYKNSMPFWLAAQTKTGLIILTKTIITFRSLPERITLIKKAIP